MAQYSQVTPTTKSPHFATLLLMALAPQEVGQRIRAARIAKGWTHEELREAFQEATGEKVDLRTVQRWQRGYDEKKRKSTLPRLGRLMDLADVLEVPRSWFVEEAQPADPHELVRRLSLLEEAQKDNAEILAELLRLARDAQAPPESADA